MKRLTTISFASIIVLSLAACGNTRGERAVSGGAIGAGVGAVGTAVVGGSVATGAAVGAAAGALTGVLTDQSEINLD